MSKKNVQKKIRLELQTGENFLLKVIIELYAKPIKIKKSDALVFSL